MTDLSPDEDASAYRLACARIQRLEDALRSIRGEIKWSVSPGVTNRILGIVDHALRDTVTTLPPQPTETSTWPSDSSH